MGVRPSLISSVLPSMFPSSIPSGIPSVIPSLVSSRLPSDMVSITPSEVPSKIPSMIPSILQSSEPSLIPSVLPSMFPSSIPSSLPIAVTSRSPSNAPSSILSGNPSMIESNKPSIVQSILPSTELSALPSNVPSGIPSSLPISLSTNIPSANPSFRLSSQPSIIPFSQNPTFPESCADSPFKVSLGNKGEGGRKYCYELGESSINYCKWSELRKKCPVTCKECEPLSEFPSSIPTFPPTSYPFRSPTSSPSKSATSTPSVVPFQSPFNSFNFSTPPTILSSLPSPNPSIYPNNDIESFIPSTIQCKDKEGATHMGAVNGSEILTTCQWLATNSSNLFKENRCKWQKVIDHCCKTCDGYASDTSVPTQSPQQPHSLIPSEEISQSMTYLFFPC